MFFRKYWHSFSHQFGPDTHLTLPCRPAHLLCPKARFLTLFPPAHVRRLHTPSHPTYTSKTRAISLQFPPFQHVFVNIYVVHLSRVSLVNIIIDQIQRRLFDFYLCNLLEHSIVVGALSRKTIIQVSHSKCSTVTTQISFHPSSVY